MKSVSILVRLGPVVAVLLAATGTPSVAQETEVDASQSARFRFGPLRFTPSIALTDVGVDSNVFNDPDRPSQDTVGALGPAASYWMRVGPSLVSGTASAQYLYFDKYKNQRAVNTTDALKWEVPLGRFTPFTEGKYSNAKDRTGYEIDTRARQISQDVVIGTAVQLSGKTRVTLSGSRSRFRYDEGETFLGVDLRALDRWTNAEALQLQYRLTSQTTFVVRSEALQDRFTQDRLRNSNSIAVLPGFEMKPTALVSGSVLVGFRNFAPLDPTIPPYRGPVAAVSARYVLGATRFGLKVGRDVAYSYQAEQPYYTMTDVGLDVTERITYAWDVVARASRQRLEYAVRQGLAAPTAPQLDRIAQYGGGIGYRVGRTVRFGIDGHYFQRRSTNATLRDFEGFRVGASITYGLQP